jgi:hypothetical protein
MDINNFNKLGKVERANNRNTIIDIIKTLPIENVDTLISELDNGDFYFSTNSLMPKFAYAGRLCEYSLELYHNLQKINRDLSLGLEDNNLFLLALACGYSYANVYTVGTKNVKLDNGDWEQLNYFYLGETRQAGEYTTPTFGEKAYLFISKYASLSTELIQALFSYRATMNNSLKYSLYAINKYAYALDLADTMTMVKYE